MPDIDTCPLCARQTRLTFHHLIPRKVHRRSHFKKHYTREELNQGIAICRACHSGIHRCLDEMTLAKKVNTLESLRTHEVLSRHFSWVARQKISH